MVVRVDELELGDTAEKEEGKVVRGAVWMADDVVGGDVIEDPTELRLVAADELETEDVAEEKDDKACEAAEDDGMEIEVDDFSGGLLLLHLYNSHRVSEVSSHGHVRSMGTAVLLDEDRDEVHLNVLDCNNSKTPILLKRRNKKLQNGWMISYVLL